MQIMSVPQPINHRAPNFVLPSVAGPKVAFADFRGRIVLLDFIRHLG